MTTPKDVSPQVVMPPAPSKMPTSPDDITPEQEDSIRSQHHGEVLKVLDPVVRTQIQRAMTGADGKIISPDRMVLVAIHRKSILVDDESLKRWPVQWGVLVYDREDFAGILRTFKKTDGTEVWAFVSNNIMNAPPPGELWIAMFDEENGATLRLGSLVAQPPIDAPAAPAP